MTKEEIFSFSHISANTTRPEEKLRFSVIGGAHSHIFQMCAGLVYEGAELVSICEDDPDIREALQKKYPSARISSEDEIYADKSIKLIASSAIPSERGRLALSSMRAGKDFFVDKVPMMTHGELDEVERTMKATGRKLFVYYCELVHNASALAAADIINRGIIGRVLHIEGRGPHRLSPASRKPWFFERDKTGGILVDIGSQQTAQMLYYTGSRTARVDFARVGNLAFPEHPDFDDFGDAMITTENGVPCHIRVDWRIPDGLMSGADMRTTIMGEHGFIELRKFCDLGHSTVGDNVFVVTDEGEFCDSVRGKLHFTYFRDLISDCLLRTDLDMTREINISAARLAINAQAMAMRDRINLI